MDLGRIVQKGFSPSGQRLSRSEVHGSSGGELREPVEREDLTDPLRRPRMRGILQMAPAYPHLSLRGPFPRQTELRMSGKSHVCPRLRTGEEVEGSDPVRDAWRAQRLHRKHQSYASTSVDAAQDQQK